MANDSARSIITKCPVCNGTGKVPLGFYDLNSINNKLTPTWGEVCRSCHGKGVIWNK